MSDSGDDGGLFTVGLILGALSYMGFLWGWLGFLGGLFILFGIMFSYDEYKEDQLTNNRKNNRRNNRRRR